MPHRLVIDTCHTYINCKFNNKLPNAAYTSSKIMLKIINSRHKPPTAAHWIKYCVSRLMPVKTEKSRKIFSFFGIMQKITTFACLFGKKP